MVPRGIEVAEEEFGLISSLPRQFGQFLGSGKSKLRVHKETHTHPPGLAQSPDTLTLPYSITAQDLREERGAFLESYKQLLEGVLAVPLPPPLVCRVVWGRNEREKADRGVSLGLCRQAMP